MTKGKKPGRPRPDPVVETILALRVVLIEYAFRVLAARGRRLGVAAVRALAPWLAKLVRSRTIAGGAATRLADSFWDASSDEGRAWLAAERVRAHLVPPAIEQVLVEAAWHDKQRAFSRLRARDPARARALLETPPAGLATADRQSLIGLLREGLSEDDRAFLERERSTLLALLPGSSLCKELAALADRLMTVTGGKLSITPPDRFEDVFERVGLKKAARASHSHSATFTTEQYWFYQLLRVLPLPHLEARWRLGPGAIVDLFLDDPDHERYRWALHGNIFRLRSPVWIRALLDRRAKFSAEGLAGSSCRSLARVLPPAERETVLEPFIDEAPNETLSAFEDAFDHLWSPSFTRRLLARPLPFTEPAAFTPLVHHGNSQVIDELARLLPRHERTFRDDLAAAWRQRDEILSRF